MAKKKVAPTPDVPMIEAVPTPTDPPAPDAGATSEPEAAPADPAPAADEPPPQVIVVFDRPPAEVEAEIRATWPKDLMAARIYRTWANGREGVDTEGGPAKIGLNDAIDAVRWLVVQPLIVVEPEPTAEQEPRAEGEVIAFPTPRLVVAPPEPLPPARTKILATRSIQHEYTLTDEERLVLGSQLANLEADCENEEADQSAKKRAMRERLSALRGERAKVADVLRRGAEVRAVAVVEVADYEDRVVRTIDENTLEVLATRSLDPHESQVPLFGTLKPKPVEPVADPVVESTPFDTDADLVDEEEDESESDTDTDTDTDEDDE